MFVGLSFKLSETRLVHWATFPVFFGQVTSAYEGIGTVSNMLHCYIYKVEITHFWMATLLNKSFSGELVLVHILTHG